MSRYYTLDQIKDMYVDQGMVVDQAIAKAKEIHRCLNTLDVGQRRSNNGFYDHIMPFFDGLTNTSRAIVYIDKYGQAQKVIRSRNW
jgi:hypothetical protein